MRLYGFRATICCQSQDIVKLLLEVGVDLNATDRQGRTPLHIAAFDSGQEAVEIAKLLIQKGADVNAKDVYSETPLAIALGARSSNVAGLLRSYGADEGN